MLENVIHTGAESTLAWLTKKDPGLEDLLDKAYGYAVFPAIGRASVVLGGARGHGEVFERGKPIGFATLSQMTVGVQVGGQTYSELILFNDKAALDAFKRNKVSFTANASAVLVKAGATGTSDFQSVVAKAYSRGGMLLEASIGGQKLTFREHLGKQGHDRRRDVELPHGDGGAVGKETTRTTEPTEAAPTPPEEPASNEPELQEDDEVVMEAAPNETDGYDEPSQDPQEGPAEDPPEDPTDDPPPASADDRPHASDGAEPPGASVAGAVADAGARVKEKAEGATAPEPRSVRRRITGSGRKLVGKVAHFISDHAGPRGVERAGLELAATRHPTLVGKPLQLLDRIKSAAKGLEDEATLGPALSEEVQAALRRMIEHDPGIEGLLAKAHGYAVFPLVGKATAALGVGYGRGEVFEQGKLIGYAAIVQLTLGVQLGGQTYDELILFENAGALERFTSGDLAFAMNASAVLLKAGAAATTNYASGTAVFVHPEGGLMIELGLGGQKFIFRRKVLGAPDAKLESPTEPARAQTPEAKRATEPTASKPATA